VKFNEWIMYVMAMWEIRDRRRFGRFGDSGQEIRDEITLETPAG